MIGEHCLGTSRVMAAMGDLEDSVTRRGSQAHADRIRVCVLALLVFIVEACQSHIAKESSVIAPRLILFAFARLANRVNRTQQGFVETPATATRLHRTPIVVTTGDWIKDILCVAQRRDTFGSTR